MVIVKDHGENGVEVLHEFHEFVSEAYALQTWREHMASWPGSAGTDWTLPLEQKPDAVILDSLRVIFPNCTAAYLPYPNPQFQPLLVFGEADKVYLTGLKPSSEGAFKVWWDPLTEIVRPV